MAILSARVNVDGPMKAFGELRREQLPWIIARSLTKTAVDGQAAARRLEGSVFRLRNDWLTRNTRITAAQKTTMVATVYEDARNRAGRVGDYLGDQQDGATRHGFVTVRSGEFSGTYRAIATKYVAPFGRVIPRELLPQNLISAVNGRFTTFNRKGQIALRNQQLVNGMVFFVQKLTRGDLAICGRRPGSHEALPFYILVREAHVSGRFPMARRVIELAEQRFPENFRLAAIETLGNDLLRGSGLRVKL